MLVGATLGMSQTASAALTWLGTYGEWQSANQSYLITSNVGYEVVAVSLATESLSAISSSVSRNGFVGSVDYSETTGPGFSVSFSANGSPGHFHVTGARLFTVTGTESISINVTRPQNALVILDRVTDGMHESVGQVDSGVLNVDLTAGTYRLAFVILRSDPLGRPRSGRARAPRRRWPRRQAPSPLSQGHKPTPARDTARAHTPRPREPTLAGASFRSSRRHRMAHGMCCAA